MVNFKVKYSKPTILDNQENLESISEVTLLGPQPTYLFTINNAGEKLVEIDKTGNITYMKDPESLTEASRVFWESLQEISW